MESTSAQTSKPMTIAALASFAAERHGDRPAIRHKQDGEWRDRSFAEVGATVREIALGLIDLGIEPGDRVCILANTAPEWTYAGLAISNAGAVVVPIYPTNSPKECEWVVGNSGARAVICENAAQVAKITAVKDGLPELRTIVVIDPADDAEGLETLDDLRARGGDAAELDRRAAAVGADDPFMFIYTSGTTGPPKGCMLSHGNGRAVCDMAAEMKTVDAGDVAYLYLPLAHVFAQLIELAGFYVGATLTYFSGDTKRIVPELAEVKPDFFPSVPRIFEKLYTLGSAQLEQASPEQRQQFRAAVELGVKVRALEARGEPVPDELREPFEQADKQIFAGVRAIFGGRLREATTGAAPIAPEILEFFYAAGCPVLEGYGMTETTGVGTVSTRQDFKFGTVGRPMPGVEVKIAGDGEVLMRGPNIFLGYYGNEQATSEVLIDGWLQTGDLGELDDDGYLRITGRKKDIIITAGGKNLTPANLENELKQSRFVSQAVMYGDRRPFPVALITLDPEEIAPWAAERDLPRDLASLATNPEVRELIQEVMDSVNSNYAQVEQIKKFVILDHDLSLETGELTPTLKVKRNVVYDKYADVFDKLYSR